MPDGIRITFPKQFTNANSKFKFFLFRTEDSNLDIKKETELDSNNSIFIPAKAGNIKRWILYIKT